MKIEGLKVHDANKPLAFHITKRDCSTGNSKSPLSCAAAKALCRADTIDEARVHIARVYIKSRGKWMRYSTPPALRGEIIAFDRGGSFQPGDYKLSPVQPTVRFGVRKRKPNNLDGSRPQKRFKPHIVKGIRSHASLGANYR